MEDDLTVSIFIGVIVGGGETTCDTSRSLVVYALSSSNADDALISVPSKHEIARNPGVVLLTGTCLTPANGSSVRHSQLSVNRL